MLVPRSGGADPPNLTLGLSRPQRIKRSFSGRGQFYPNTTQRAILVGHGEPRSVHMNVAG